MTEYYVLRDMDNRGDDGEPSVPITYFADPHQIIPLDIAIPEREISFHPSKASKAIKVIKDAVEKAISGNTGPSAALPAIEKQLATARANIAKLHDKAAA